MAYREPAFTLGIEEEYLLVDRASRDLVREPPPELLAECEAVLETQVTPEFLRSQIEVGTRVCTSAAEARTDLSRLRKTVAEVTARHGLAPIAASTHPFASWHLQKHTDKERYNILAQHLQALSTSSPFWGGEDTGLKSYRMAVFNELPRTGLPELFESWGEYERHLQ